MLNLAVKNPDSQVNILITRKVLFLFSLLKNNKIYL